MLALSDNRISTIYARRKRALSDAIHPDRNKYPPLAEKLTLFSKVPIQNTVEGDFSLSLSDGRPDQLPVNKSRCPSRASNA